MAKVIITLEDTGSNSIRYKSECETPNEVNKIGNPTLALRMASMFIDQIVAFHNEKSTQSESDKVE